MAKKKNAAKKGGKKKNGGGKGGNDFFNLMQLAGISAGVFANSKVKSLPGTGNLDPKVLAAIKIVGGRWLPRQQFAKNFVKDDELRNGFGAAIITKGVEDLLSSFGIAGLRQTKPKGNHFLAVSVEGITEPDNVNEDILAEDEYDVGDDLDTVNEDILAEDLDTVNDDLDTVNDDLDTVNEDILAEDLL